jgi:hypothetical protein
MMSQLDEVQQNNFVVRMNYSELKPGEHCNYNSVASAKTSSIKGLGSLGTNKQVCNLARVKAT